MNEKAKSVMGALSGRKGLGSKKGVNLLGIVAKLTKKRKAMDGDTLAHEKSESPLKKALEKKTGKE